MVRKFLIILILLFLSACTTEKYGKEVDRNLKKISIRDAIVDPSYVGKKLNLEGVIVTQCQAAGCWFFLKDDTGIIYIDLSKEGFTIPPKTGKKALVTGTVVKREENIIIEASGVEIR